MKKSCVPLLYLHQRVLEPLIRSGKGTLSFPLLLDCITRRIEPCVAGKMIADRTVGRIDAITPRVEGLTTVVEEAFTARDQNIRSNRLFVILFRLHDVIEIVVVALAVDRTTFIIRRWNQSINGADTFASSTHRIFLGVFPKGAFDHQDS
jgi:hypothetical protein